MKYLSTVDMPWKVCVNMHVQRIPSFEGFLVERSTLLSHMSVSTLYMLHLLNLEAYLAVRALRVTGSVIGRSATR